jgi:hypothetical protein
VAAGRGGRVAPPNDARAEPLVELGES